MESKAIDPVAFRETQHKQWDSAAVGWKEWSDFNDRAAGHISERLVELAGVQVGKPGPGRRRRLWRAGAHGRAHGRPGGPRRGHGHLCRDAGFRA